MKSQAKIFVINLARRTDRLKYMRALSDKCQVDFTIMEAVDGADHSAHVDIGPSTGLITGRRRSRFDYACVTSHRRCWMKMIKLGLNECIILEDDVVLSDDFSLLTNPLWVPEDADLVKLETTNYYVELADKHWLPSINRNIARLHSRHPGAGGYLITRRAAKILLSETRVPEDQIDHILFRKFVESAAGLVVYQLDPAPVIQGMYHSELHQKSWAKSTLDEDRKRRGFGFAHRIHRKAPWKQRLNFNRRGKSLLDRVRRKIRCAYNGRSFTQIKFR